MKSNHSKVPPITVDTRVFQTFPESLWAPSLRLRGAVHEDLHPSGSLARDESERRVSRCLS